MCYKLGSFELLMKSGRKYFKKKLLINLAVGTKYEIDEVKGLNTQCILVRIITLKSFNLMEFENIKIR